MTGGETPRNPSGYAAGTRRVWTGINAIGIVIQQLPLPAAQRVRVAGTPEALRQGQGHRILTAVQAQQRALHPQGQHRPQAVRQLRQLRCQQVADIIQCSRLTHGHTRVLWGS